MCGLAQLTWISTVRLPREPQEIHSRYQDGLWWSEEGQGEERPHHVSFFFLTCWLLELTFASASHSYLQENTK